MASKNEQLKNLADERPDTADAEVLSKRELKFFAEEIVRSTLNASSLVSEQAATTSSNVAEDEIRNKQFLNNL